MELKQVLFKKIYDYFKKINHEINHENINNLVKLSDIKERINILASILNGEPIKVVSAEREGGYSENNFFLPVKFDHFETLQENINFYIFRVAYLSVQKSLNLNWDSKEEYSYQNSKKYAKNTSKIVLEKLYKDYTGIIELADSVINNEIKFQIKKINSKNSKINYPETINFSDIFSDNYPEIDLSYLFGHWMQPPQILDDLKTVRTNKKEIDKNNKNNIETELEAPSKEDIKTIQVDTKAIQNYTLSHHFEKVETIEEFNGTWRDTDGSDDLSEHQDALEEVDLRQTVRTDDTVHSVYRIEFIRNTIVGESKEIESKEYFIPYKEWDMKRKIYKADFCKVFPKKFRKTLPGYTEQILNENKMIFNQLQKKFAFMFNEYEEQKRQVYGEDIDFDAVIDNYVNVFSGKSPSEKLYLSKRKKNRNISILILMDLSLSTGAYSDGKSVIDIEKKSVTIFSELMSMYQDRFEIDGFYSKTRNHCEYISIKSFEENWNSSKNRLGALEPIGYTRIGPAIRHATSILEQEKSNKKWILLLSDGKPNDYDKYEGRYGMADVKQSIREANVKGVNLYALTVDNVARNYLPLMLGHGNYRILPHPGLLPYAMEEFYFKIR